MDAEKLRHLISNSKLSEKEKKELYILISIDSSKVKEKLGLSTKQKEEKIQPKPTGMKMVQEKSEAKPFSPKNDKKASVSNGK